jgi:hypothetical protein
LEGLLRNVEVRRVEANTVQTQKRAQIKAENLVLLVLYSFCLILIDKLILFRNLDLVLEI